MSYTQIPNDILDNMISGSLNKAELQVYTLIIRETIGYHRESMLMANNYIKTWTNLSKRTITSAIVSLENKGLITVVRSKHKVSNLAPILSSIIGARNCTLVNKELRNKDNVINSSPYPPILHNNSSDSLLYPESDDVF
jgi:phage replication O-like protein O